MENLTKKDEKIKDKFEYIDSKINELYISLKSLKNKLEENDKKNRYNYYLFNLPTDYNKCHENIMEIHSRIWEIIFMAKTLNLIETYGRNIYKKEFTLWTFSVQSFDQINNLQEDLKNVIKYTEPFRKVSLFLILKPCC